MQGNAARKARRTIIGRTLGGRASFKALQESLKLHLSATFVSTTLLTRGFFLILFEDEEGATSTKKLASVEWNGLSLSFSRQPSTCPAHTNATRVRAQDPTSTKTHDPQALGGYQGHTEAKVPRNCTLAPPPPINLPRNLLGNQVSDPGQWSATARAQEDLSMTEPPPSPSRAKGETRSEARKPPEEATTPKNKLFLELPGLNCPQTRKPEANANPFASSEEGSQGVNLRARPQEDTLEGWSFQGRRKHAPKLASPRPEPHHTFPRTPQQETPLGGKRVQLHSEVHPSYFSSLGMSIPTNGKPFRARIWPVLTREKNSRKETLVYSKNQARPSLPINMRITGSTEAVWTQDTAWADLTQRLEVELEEKVLRYRLTLKDRPQLEWSWQKESSRGGTECTILAHIDSGTNALSI
ncbi:unnamed protein product [Sphagnum jensenii]